MFPLMRATIAGCLLNACLGARCTVVADEPPLPTTLSDAGIWAPNGFEVSLYAGDDLAHDVFSMALDARGRVVVAGKNYIKVLHDDDADGRADRATLFSEFPASGAHGLCFDGPHLLATGDKALLYFRDNDGDGAADGSPDAWATLNHAEHGANGVTRGPDGAFYVACGNDAGVSQAHANDVHSPVRQPNCGAMLRFSKNGQRSQILAHGFRNPYDLDFHAHGNLLTVDADGERDQFLPWYTPTRLFDVAIGMHHGWVLRGWQHSWNRPSTFFDNVGRLDEIGRGSPTGLVVYRHAAFPTEYHDNVLSCCWTLGRVYRFKLTREASSFSCRREVFLETTGEVGFAPVDLAVGSKGELYVAIGGRGTRGGVFCVRYVGAPNAEPKGAPPTDDLTSVLRAPQPLAAWSRSRWLPVAEELGQTAFHAAAADSTRPAIERVRAIEILVDVFDGLPEELATDLIDDADTLIAARTCWAVACRPPKNARELLVAAARHASPHVARAAWEASLALSAEGRASPLSFTPATDRRVRAAARLAMAHADVNAEISKNWPVGDQLAVRALASPLPELSRTTEQELAGVTAEKSKVPLGRDDFAVIADEFVRTDSMVDRRDFVRLLQLALGDVNAQSAEMPGLERADQNPILEEERAAALQIAATYPTGDTATDRELARLMAMMELESPTILSQLTEAWTKTSSVEGDLFFLMVCAKLPGERSTDNTRRTAAALASLHGKMEAAAQTPSRNWPQRVMETFRRLCRHDSKLAAALVEQPEFCKAEQSLFGLTMDGSPRLAAARKLLAAVRAADDVRWTSELVQLVDALPSDEALPAWRSQWDDYLLRDDLALALARHANPADRERLIEALGSVQPHVVLAVSTALLRLPKESTAEEIAVAVSALRQACLTPQAKEVRETLQALLRHWTEAGIEIVEKGAGRDLLGVYQPWFTWFEAKHPLAAAKLNRGAGHWNSTWLERIEQIDWTAGNASRGIRAFEKFACAKCHAGQNRLGPDLAGVTGRLSRADLLAAIVDPNRDVSPLYQSSQLVTASGKFYVGLVVYESPEGTLIQTSPDTTVRITGEEILALRKSKQSFMPGGLLQNATDMELADLVAYLATLSKSK